MHQKTTLDNGLCLLTESMPHTRSVTINIFIGTGSRYEADASAGTAHFIEHLCFKGTARYPTSRDIATAIEGVGGIINGGTDKEITVFWAKVPDSHLGIALDVLSEMVLSPRFDSAEIEKERSVIIEEIKMSLDYPPQRAEMLIDELLWPGHPLGRDIAGSRESVSQITRGNLLDFLQTRYLPQKTVVSIAGNIQHQAVLELIRRTFEHWPEAQMPPGFLPFQAGEPASRIKVEKRDIEQVNLCLALPGLSLLHPARYQLDLLNVLLGEGTSCRLFTEIRDRLGLTYNIQSHLQYYLDCGSLNIAAGTDPQNLAVLIRAILEQLSLLHEGVPESELAKAKEVSKGRLLLRLEDSQNVSGWIGSQEILTGRVLSAAEVEARIEAVTTGDIKRLARKLIATDKLRLAVVGPVASVELENLMLL